MAKNLQSILKNDIIEDHTFENQTFDKLVLTSKVFSYCEFVNCKINEVDFSNGRFSECKFHQSQISMSSVKSCKIQSVVFSESKIVGIDFAVCNPLLLSMEFTNCSVQGANFDQLKLNDSRFFKSIVKECSFVEADLTLASFKGCDLAGSIFNNTILNETDFSEAFSYVIDPMNNKLKGAKFTLPEAIALLEIMGIEIK